MRTLAAVALLLVSTPALAGTFTGFTPVHVAPVIHVAPTAHVAPIVRSTPVVVRPGLSAVRPGLPPVRPVAAAHDHHSAHNPVPLLVSVPAQKPACVNAKAGDKDCGKR